MINGRPYIPDDINSRLALAASMDAADVEILPDLDGWEQSRTVTSHDPPPDATPSPGDGDDRIAPVPIADLIQNHPRLSPPLIDGLLRLGETCNIIAPAKCGKSWLTYGLALSVATGQEWLGYYPCKRGRVLLIDNELHSATIAHRIPAVADAMSIRREDYIDCLDVVSLRGRLTDLAGIGSRIVSGIEHGRYDCIIVDAWYRVLTASENDNQAMATAYNMVDQFAARTGAAWLLIHHSSKGSQSDKRVTDVGAGAGSQSRAADTHLILREHEEEGCVTLDAAVRSFPPVAPLPLRWTFPAWTVDPTLDPTALKRPVTRSEATQDARDRETMTAIETAIGNAGEPLSRYQMRKATGYSDGRVGRGIRLLTDGGDITIHETIEHGNGRTYDTYTLAH